MRPLMYSQKWFSINEFPLDYFELLYKFFAVCGRSIPATYYNLDLSNSVYDGDLLDGGSYEEMGNLSGLLWKKISMVQVYQPETVNFNFTGDERGFGKFDQLTTLWIPSIYEMRPYVHDYVIFDHVEDRDNQFKAKNAMYTVVNVEKAGNTEFTFWKIYLKASFRTKLMIEKQLSGVYEFEDYEKQIYKLSDAIFMNKMMLKNQNLAVNSFFRERAALYTETIPT